MTARADLELLALARGPIGESGQNPEPSDSLLARLGTAKACVILGALDGLPLDPLRVSRSRTERPFFHRALSGGPDRVISRPDTRFSFVFGLSEVRARLFYWTRLCLCVCARGIALFRCRFESKLVSACRETCSPVGDARVHNTTGASINLFVSPRRVEICECRMTSLRNR